MLPLTQKGHEPDGSHEAPWTCGYPASIADPFGFPLFSSPF